MDETVYSQIADLAEQALKGADIMPDVISLGREVLAMGDEMRWVHGDLSCLVQKCYGHNSIKMFAEGIHVDAERLKEYRTVCLRFTKNVRADILQEFPELTYSDFRLAARLVKTPGDEYQMKHAQRLLKMIHKYEWTVEVARNKASRMLGNEPTKRALLSTEATLCAIIAGGTQLVFEVPSGLTKDIKQGMWVHLTVRSAEL